MCKQISGKMKWCQWGEVDEEDDSRGKKNGRPLVEIKIWENHINRRSIDIVSSMHNIFKENAFSPASTSMNI